MTRLSIPVVSRDDELSIGGGTGALGSIGVTVFALWRHAFLPRPIESIAALVGTSV